MSRTPLLVALPAITVCAFGIQERDLHSDLKNLNTRHNTRHYALAGTVSDAKLQEYGQALEYVYREYAAGFGELLQRHDGKSDQDVNRRFSVVILATDDEYAEFTSAYFGEMAEHSSGLFVASADLLVVRDGGDREDTHGTLFHEAFHQFAQRYVRAIPTWVDEGVATYYETARPGQSGLVFNRPRTTYFKLVRNAAANRKLIPLRELTDSSKAAFYDQAPIDDLRCSHKTLCYAQSYTLVSYMIGDGEGRKHLQAYLRRLSAATTPEDARRITREMFTDKLLGAMVEPWLAHVNRF